MLIPDLVPMTGAGYIGGQLGTFKTFISDDMAVAIASGGEFAGRQVTVPGAVAMLELEGSDSELRLTACAQNRRITEQLPVLHLIEQPPTILNGNGRSNPDWAPYSDRLVKLVTDLRQRFSLRTRDSSLRGQAQFHNITWAQPSAVSVRRSLQSR